MRDDTDFPYIINNVYNVTNEHQNLNDIELIVAVILKSHYEGSLKFLEKMFHENFNGNYEIDLNFLEKVVDEYMWGGKLTREQVVKCIAKEIYYKLYNNLASQEKKDCYSEVQVSVQQVLLERIKNIEGITLTKGARKTLKALLKTFLGNSTIKRPQLVGTVNMSLVHGNIEKYGNPIALHITTNNCIIFFRRHFECGSVYWYHNLLDMHVRPGAVVSVEDSVLPRLVVSTDESIAYSDIRKQVKMINIKESLESNFKDTVIIDDKKAYAIQSLIEYSKVKQDSSNDTELLLKILG